MKHKLTFFAAVVGVLAMSGVHADNAQPIQRDLVPNGTPCTKKLDNLALNGKGQLCLNGKWTDGGTGVTWKEGLSIYDTTTGCLYQVNKGPDGLQTALIGSPKGCGSTTR